ncbi:MAG: DNA mismatch repair endonuclease MutL [Fibromonadaceae bacterium]|jgi:DNA mismatch repair protein MutL|nr:DNA mismatch repair endonuclease MutL [Fibromonadaceae bacterium]
MPQIQLLPDYVINQIAAGEVIERPASAVKELVENSLDAGATQIKLSVKRGGKDLIQITDNGRGIESEDVETSVLRHATSKLRDVDDLLKLGTNGFRGEALSSIASISKFTIESRTQNANTGVRAEFEGGTLKAKEEIAIPFGTIITVQDLFFNAPVRAEFLKNDSIENSRILDCIIRIAMANENVRFEYRADNRMLFCAAEGSLEARISDCIGASAVRSLREIDWHESGIRVRGFVSAPESAQTSKRNIPYIFLQKRPIYNALISKAISQAYFPYGDYSPIAIIFLEMPLATFDVNVHPAKREVRFSKDNAVFLAVSHAVHNALQSSISYPSISITNMLRENAPAYVAQPETQKLIENGELRIENKLGGTQELFPDERIVAIESESNNSQFSILNSQFSNDCLQLDKSYIVCAQGQSLLIIDQHRAHKLLLYERALQALQNGESLDSQELLFPESIEIPAHLSPILEAQKNELKKLGFYIEPFGTNTWRLRGIPAHLRIGTAARAITGFLENANESRESDMFKKNALAFANSSAIPSGTELSVQDMKSLVSDLLSLQNPYETPKGEAIFMRMPVEDIKRKF